MRIDERQVDDITILTIRGEFDARTLPVAVGKLDALFAQLRTCIVFNVARIDIVTSTALGFFVDATKRARGLGGDVLISEPSALFRSTVDTLRIGSVLTMIPENGDAGTHFRELAESREPEVEWPKSKKRLWPFGKKS